MVLVLCISGTMHFRYYAFPKKVFEQTLVLRDLLDI